MQNPNRLRRSSSTARPMKLSPIAAGCATLMLVAGMAQAQTPPSDDAPAVVVTGIRQSMQSSLNLKRNSIGIVDGIVAEDIGKFPDTNLAESLQRISGVSIDRSIGEGSKVTVRGIGPDFNMVLLNGRQMPTSNLGDLNGRAFDFANIASEGISQIQVYKSSRAETPTGGIGATLNVMTARPFDNPGFHSSVGIKGVKDTSATNLPGDVRDGKSITPEISGLYSNTSADGTMGISLSASHQERNLGYNRAEVANGWRGPFTADENNWGTLPQPGQPNANLITNRPSGSQIYNVPQNLNYTFSGIQRQRTNGQLALQFKPSDALLMTLDFTLSENKIQTRAADTGVWFNFGKSSSTWNAGKVASPSVYTEIFGPGEAQDIALAAALFATKTVNKSIGFNAVWKATKDLKFDLDVHSSSAESKPDSPYGSFNRMANSAFTRYSTTVDFTKDFPVVKIDGVDYAKGPAQLTGSTFQNGYMKGEIDQIQAKGALKLPELESKLNFGVTSTTANNRSAFSMLFDVKPTLSPLTAKVEGAGNTCSHTFFTEIDVHTKATLAQSKPAGFFQSNVEEIIVVCKTHFDIGYTHRVKDLLQYYRTSMIDKAMNTMDQSKSLPPEQQFIWTGPGWVMAKVTEDWPGQTPERRKRIDDYFKSGKFVTHALPFTVESELMDPEDFARGFQSASFVSRKYGFPLPRDAKMTDVPSHGSVLATALAQAGVKFMHIGCNWPSGSVTCPPLFWWEGPDGSRVMTIYSSIYGDCTGLWPSMWGDEHSNPGVLGRHLLPPKNWPYKAWVAIMVTPDNSGPPSVDAMKPLFDEVHKTLPNVKVRMGRMEDFADAIIKSGAELPVVTAEMPDTWIHGCMCDPGGMKTARNVHPLMPAAETLNTQLRQWGVPVTDSAKEIQKAYEQSVLYSEHTWGGAASVNQYGEAFKKLPPNHFKDLEGSWEDKTDYIRTASKLITQVIATNLMDLAKNVKGEGTRVVVYNPLPWPRSGIADVAGRRFLARDVPACGYKTFRSDPSDPSDGTDVGNTLENQFFQITFDPARGTISSLIDKRTGRDWADPSAERGLGQYLNERFSLQQTADYCRDYQHGRSPGWLHTGMYKPGMPGNVPYRAASPIGGKLQVIRDNVAQSAVVDLPANPGNHLSGATLRVTLYDEQPYVDLEITVKEKSKDNWPEADWLCLPFKVNSPKFTVGRTLGMMNPANILPGANRDLYAVGSGVTLTDADGSGIAVCPLDHPLVSLGRPGMWKCSSDYLPGKPVVYLNLYNNQWNTNYRYWYPGTWSSRVRLWTFGKGATTESALVTPSLEARVPLLAVSADGKGGCLPAEQAGIRTSRKGIQVTAYGTDFDGNKGTLLRVWEEAGVTGEVTVTFPSCAKFEKATPVNLRGEKTGELLKIKRGKLKFNLKAYAPASFILE